jgi:HSP20 family protein
MLDSLGDPFSAMLALQRALDSRLKSNWMEVTTTGSGAFPPTNIFQQGDDFVAILELPGIDRSDLQIEAKENTVRVLGKKKIGFDDKASVHRRERSSGAFDRTISLPIAIEVEGIRAEYRDGILTLNMPRAASAKPRAIEIG